MNKFFSSTLRLYLPYIMFVLASLISGIGGGFIQVVVYNKISAQGSSPLYFSLAFSLTIFPALLGSHLGKKIAEKEKYNLYLVFSQILAIGVIFLVGYITLEDNTKYILLCEAVTSFSASIAFPSLQKLIKLTFKSNKLPLAAKIDTYAYGANIILGLGLGSFLSAFISLESILALALCFFTISAVIFYFSTPKNVGWKTGTSFQNNLCWGTLSQRQKISFILMPTLIIVGAPATSLLPSLYSNFSGSEFNHYLISPVLLLLVFRSIGQFLGPLVIKSDNFDNLSQDARVIYFSLLFFLVTYIFIFSINNFFIVLMLIVIAHISSNVVYSLAIYLTLASFTSDEIAKISSFQYQINQLVITFVSIFSGILANFIGGKLTIIIFACTGIGFFALINQLFLKNEVVEHC